MSWTDERVELLKKMWTEGQSASQIAKELGGVTRNAVIGKVHRLGLSNRVEGAAPTPAPAAAPAAVAKPAAPEPVAAPAAAAAPRVEPEPEPVRPTIAAVPPRPAPAAPQPVAAVAPVPGVVRKPALVPAGQPLPPQPSLNEISPETLASVREVEKRSRKISLMELTERTCKWPIGDPATENFYFCGLPSSAGKPYCEAHVSVAFQPMSARRDRRR
ncbi:GcrA cell cycle regulator [Rhodobacter capsulatus]|uniref:GcrA family cell cycle regulator n=4 Tax=Rhodobacter capsulatus TaxID=1061 RepID=UPI000DAC965F|nr:GcrA family cell cycle regulator [Rhodobacter capsulatus]PZX28616.1 GcrA cell cycle regulator [Rhodobacter capsulatus]QNR62892.1 GcrA cell cycle regulator [Rhodobacter capsulatus]